MSHLCMKLLFINSTFLPVFTTLSFKFRKVKADRKTIYNFAPSYNLSTAVVRYGMALDYRSYGHGFETCYRHIRCVLLVK